MDIGAALREARQRKGRTLRQVSSATKISTEILEKIERNQYDRLPGGLFRRGYLRAFARDVGVDPETVVAAYREEYEPPEVPQASRGNSVSPEQVRRLASAATVLVLVVGLALGVLWGGNAEDPERAGIPVLPTTNEVQVVDTTAATAQRSGAEGLFALRFDATFTEPCWISAIVDGVPTTYGILEPGTPLVIEAAREIVLRVGNAGAVGFSINGHPGRSLGSPGQVVNLRITPETYKDLVQVPARTEA